MIEIPLTLLSARLSPICKITKEKGKQFTITYYKKEVGYIIPAVVATAITGIKKTEDVSLTRFKNTAKTLLQKEVDCIYLTSHGEKVAAIVNPKFACEVVQ